MWWCVDESSACLAALLISRKSRDYAHTVSSLHHRLSTQTLYLMKYSVTRQCQIQIQLQCCLEVL